MTVDDARGEPPPAGSEIGLYPGRDATQLGETNVGRDLISIKTYSALYTAQTLAAIHQLPPDIGDYTGRVNEFAQAWAAFTEPSDRSWAPILTIVGRAGVGKSALAIHLAHSLLSLSPDGELYFNFRGADQQPQEPLAVLGQFLRALGVPGDAIPEDPIEREGMYRSHLANKRFVILLDNVRDVSQVRPLLPASPTCFIIVTSRWPLAALEGAKTLVLDLLKAEEAIDLLSAVVGTERVSNETEAAHRVAELCGYLPLALRIAGARLKANPTWPVSKLADRLSDRHRRLDQLVADDLEVRASFVVGYVGLRESDAQAFRLLGLMPGYDFSPDLVAALTQRNASAAEDILDRLVEAQLVEVDSASDRYRFHDLLRLFAVECLKKSESRGKQRSAVKRALGWYQWRLQEATEAFWASKVRSSQKQPFKVPQEALEWFETERMNLTEAVTQAYEMSFFDQCWQLADFIGFFCEISSYWKDWRQIVDTGLAAARQSENRISEAEMFLSLSNFHRARSEWNDSKQYGERALEIAKEHGDLYLESRANTGLGIATMEEGALGRALELFQENLEIEKRRPGVRGEPSISSDLSNIGVVYQRQGKWRDAIENFKQSLEIDRKNGSVHGEAITLASLGLVQADQLQWEDAVRSYHESVVSFGEMRDRHREAQVLCHLAVAYANLGKWDDAISSCEQAVTTFRELNDAHWERQSVTRLREIVHLSGGVDSPA